MKHDMSPRECIDCPRKVGDIYKRDCTFPNCMGGWEKAYYFLFMKYNDLLIKMSPRLWNKEMSDAWHNNIPNVAKAFDALLNVEKVD